MLRKTNKRFLRLFLSLTILSIPVLLVLGMMAWPAPTEVIQAAESNAVAEQTGFTVSFNTTSYSTNEGSSITVAVQISPAITQTDIVSVTYRTTNGSAIKPDDYEEVQGSLIFISSTGTLLSFTIDTVQDTIPEEDETVIIILQDPVNGQLGTDNVATLTIVDDDPDPTATSTSGTATPIYVDLYEANNTIQTAYTIEVNNTSFCTSDNATLWPSGDIDFYRFWLQAGSAYTVKTDSVDVGLDTYMILYDSNGNQMAENDSSASTALNSVITFSAHTSGYYYVRVTNEDAADPADKTYCVEINEIAGTATPTPLPTQTPLPSATPVPGADACESNGSFNDACIIAPNEQIALNFVPDEADAIDNDYFKMWVKESWSYTCETTGLSGYNDTNLIMYDANQNGLGGNNDKAFDDLGSAVTYRASYTGWVYVLVGPVVEISYADSYRYTYNLVCTSDATEPTVTPTPTTVFVSQGNTGNTGGFTPNTATPIPTSTPGVNIVETIAALETAQAQTESGIGTGGFQPPTQTPPAVVNIAPLPTSTPFIPQAIVANLDFTIFYDENENNLPEIDEGITDMPVFIYDGATGQLLTLGYTNMAGNIQFSVSPTTNALRLSIPFLNVSEIISTSDNMILVRISPNNLPIVVQ